MAGRKIGRTMLTSRVQPFSLNPFARAYMPKPNIHTTVKETSNQARAMNSKGYWYSPSNRVRIALAIMIA